MAIKDYINLKTKEEVDLIEKQLLTKRLEIPEIYLESLIDVISCAKTNLNEEIKDFIELENPPLKTNLFLSVLEAKNKNIDKLVANYNKSIFDNKIEIDETNRKIFDNITSIGKLKLEIDNFNFDNPITYTIRINTYDGEIINYPIIPYSHSGLFKEYFNISEKEVSEFEVTNKENIFFYSCRYDQNGFVLGNELDYKYDKDYFFHENKLVLSEKIRDKEIIATFIPSNTAYEITVNKKIRSIELLPINDKQNIDKRLKKRLVISSV